MSTDSPEADVRELFAAYASGEIDGADAERVAAYVREHPEAQAEIEATRALLADVAELGEDEPPAPDWEAMARAVMSEIRSGQASRTEEVEARQGRVVDLSWWRRRTTLAVASAVAAAAVLLLLVRGQAPSGERATGTSPPAVAHRDAPSAATGLAPDSLPSSAWLLPPGEDELAQNTADDVLADDWLLGTGEDSEDILLADLSESDLRAIDDALASL